MERQHSSTTRTVWTPLSCSCGLTNSPATFQTMMNHLFWGLIAKGHVVIYMDDIPSLRLPSKNSTTDHTGSLAAILAEISSIWSLRNATLRSWKLKIPWTVYRLWQNQWWIRLRSRRLQIGHSHVIQIVRSFLGFTNFIDGSFATSLTLTKPLNAITSEKNAKWEMVGRPV